MRTTIELAPLQILTATADANTTGSVRRLPQPGSVTQYAAESIAASTAVEFGPFPEVRHYEVISDTGALVLSIAPASISGSGDLVCSTAPSVTKPVVANYVELLPGEEPDAPTRAGGIRLWVNTVNNYSVLCAKFWGGNTTIVTDPD